MAAILVVDDEGSARTTLALLLRKRNHRVTEADGVGVATSSGPPAANTTAEPIAKVATAATEALTRPRR